MLLTALLVTAFLCGCGSKKEKKGAAVVAETVSDNDFTNQFLPITLKYIVADTSLDRMNKDEKPLAISGKTFFPDSLIQGFFGTGAKVKYYPVGKAQNGDNELYVLMKAVSPEKKCILLLCYDNALAYKDGLVLCQADADPHTFFSGSIDNSYNIKVVREERTSPEDVTITDHTMAYNNGRLMMVVNNDPEQQLTVVNPIDTLPQTRKFSGDYGTDKDNFISIRDGKDSSGFIFFYHFNKAGGDCGGEIKGKGDFTGATTARFMQDGDPCVINFTFTGSQITVKEDHGCGNYRGLDCKLDVVYTKKKKAGAAAETDQKKKEIKTAKPGAPVKTDAAKIKPKPVVKKAPVPAQQEQ
jgi:hypothetical protein